MRAYYAAICILVLLCGGLFGYAALLKTESASLIEKTDAVRHAAAEDDAVKTEESVRALRDKWEEVSPRLALLTSHETLDEIMLSVARAVAYAENREKPELMAEIYALERLFSHIFEKEALVIYNIF